MVNESTQVVPGWLLVVLLVRYLQKKMKMVIIIEMLTTRIAVDGHEEGCIRLGYTFLVDFIIGKKLYSKCDA